jgi:hypothetical protein
MEATRRNRLKKVITRAVFAILIVVSVFLTLYAVELKRTEAEFGGVLSDLFSEGASQDGADSLPARKIQFIILSNAEPPGVSPGEGAHRWHVWFDDRSRFPQASPMTRYSFLLTNVFPTKIKADIHLAKGAEAVLLPNSDFEHMTPREFEQRFPENHGEYTVISQAGFNFDRTEAIFYGNHFCPGLCGGGEYILARKINGVWHIVDQHRRWVS